MPVKYQVFVSSTFSDLISERQDTIKSILDLGHIPAGMELFPATDVGQMDYIRKVIDECDYYVLIIGGRYGSTNGTGISFTEIEYDYAAATGKTVLAFVHGDANLIPLGKSDVAPDLVKRLNKFREKVMRGRLVKQWTTRENLEPLVLKALVHAFHHHPGVGWIRANAASGANPVSSSAQKESRQKPVTEPEPEAPVGEDMLEFRRGWWQRTFGPEKPG